MTMRGLKPLMSIKILYLHCLQTGHKVAVYNLQEVGHGPGPNRMDSPSGGNLRMSTGFRCFFIF